MPAKHKDSIDNFMQNIDHIIEHAEAHCAKHGTRLTRKRKFVLHSLLSAKKALSAYELVDICEEKFGEKLSAVSAYRMLDFLVEENLAHRLELANKYVACEHIDCDHTHSAPQFLICKKCNKVKEVSINPDMIKDLQTSVQNSGFRLVSPQLEINCLCEECLT